MTSPTVSSPRIALPAATGWRDQLARAAVFRLLERLHTGCITLREGSEVYRFGQPGTSAALTAEIRVLHPSVYRAVLLGGSIGAGEAYMAGAWRSPDLVAVVRLFVRNMDLLQQMDGGLSRLRRAGGRLVHWLQRNTLRGARSNIRAHYDLSNDFFALFLDRQMMYSAAIYPSADATLDEASVYKLDHICRRLQLGLDDHLLEIGTGWGGLAIHAARNYGCRVTTTTISAAQYEYACRRVEEEGLSDRVTVLAKDYRELDGRYDKLVSVEMVEAVGHDYFDLYFRRCCELLKPDGVMLMQAITIADQRYEQARRSVDFIQRYIFPGGCLPSVAVIAERIARCTDMTIAGLEDIGADYARTLVDWRHRFRRRADDVRRLGFDDVFMRMWEYYLAYCEGGFTERAIGCVQVLAARPQCRNVPGPGGRRGDAAGA